MALTTSLITPTQDCWGTVNVVTGATLLFSEISTDLIVHGWVTGINEASRVGLQYNFPGVQLSAGGRILNPPSFSAATLTLTPIATPLANMALTVEAVLDNQPTPFSSSNFPGTGVPTINVTKVRTGSGVPQSVQTFYTWAAGSTTPLVIPLDPTKLMVAFNTIRTAPTWQGVMALVVRGPEAQPGALDFGSFRATELTDPPTLSVTWVGHHTGFRVAPGVDPDARAITSMRSGFPTLSTDLIEDGDAPGVWVRADEWDPEDEYETGDTYVPSPNEGNRVDEVPQ